MWTDCIQAFCSKQIILFLTPPLHLLPKQQKQNNPHKQTAHYLSLLLSHSSWASRRILSSSPCRAEEMLSCDPAGLSLRLTAVISSSSSTQEPEEETAGVDEEGRSKQEEGMEDVYERRRVAGDTSVTKYFGYYKFVSKMCFMSCDLKLNINLIKIS